MKRHPYQAWLLSVVASFLFSPLVLTSSGCGGSKVTQIAGTTTTEETGPTVDITGTVSIPTTTTSSLISALGVRVMKNATTDTAASGLTCTGYTLEGDYLGEATTAADGIFTLAAVIESLKPTDATTTSWTARFYVQCTDADGKYDIRNYGEASVTEGTTTSISCSADPDTTLTTMDLLSKSGCLIGSSCTMSGVDPLCFMEVQKKAYKDSSTASGTGIQDDLGAVKEIMRLCMAATTPAALGLASPEAMISAIQAGTLTSAQLDLCGASSAQKEKAATGATAASYLRNIFYSNIAGGSGVSATLALEMKEISQAEAGSACDLAKSDSTYAANLFATYGKASDPSELKTMMDASNLDKTILATMAQYCPSNKCDFTKFNPAVLTGTLSGCGMDPKTCGFVDADGKLQSVFDKLKLTIDGTDRAGIGTDFDKLRSLGASWGNTFKTQGIATAVTGEAAANRMAQLFGAKIGTANYDPTTAGALFTTYQTNIIGSGGTALDTCLASATTDATKLACYATGSTGGTTLKANGASCSAGAECSSGICSSGACSATTTTRYYVYVTNIGTNNVSAFAMNSATGALTAVSGSPFSTGSTPSDLTVTANGKFLYTGNSAGDNISGFSIDPLTGALTALTGSPYATGSGTVPTGMATSSNSAYLYVGYASADQIQAFNINATSGVLTTNGSSVIAQDMVQKLAFVTTPSAEQFLFSTSNGTSDVISGYPVNAATGQLGSRSDHSLGQDTIALAADPTGKFLYAVEPSVGILAGMSINGTTGSLTNIASYSNGTPNRGVAVTPNGKFLYASNAGSSTVCYFGINVSTGALVYQGDGNCADMGETGSTEFITIDPQGKFLFATHSGQGKVYSYSINDTTGALTAVGNYATGTGVGSVEVIGITQ